MSFSRFIPILFLAAITSSLSMLQPSKAFFQEALGYDNKKATMLVTVWGLAQLAGAIAQPGHGRLLDLTPSVSRSTAD